jgi:hypothetical protein
MKSHLTLPLSLMLAVSCTGQILSSPDLGSLAKQGELTPVRAADAQALSASQTADHALVDAYLAAHPEARPLFAAPQSAAVKGNGDGNYRVTGYDSLARPFSVVTMGREWTYSSVAARLRTAGSQDNQARIYAGLYGKVPSACRTNAPAPSATGALSAADLRVLNQQMTACYLAARPSFGQKPLPALAPASQPSDEAGAPGAVVASAYNWAGDGASAHPLTSCSIYDCFSGNWTGKFYDSTIKNQGNRGTCVSFAIAAAMERLYTQELGEHVNLSEQALYAQAKLAFDVDDPSDGLVAPSTMGSLVNSGFFIPHEADWRYNMAPFRQVSTVNGTTTYQYSCASPASVDNGNGRYAGTYCSDTVHEGELITTSAQSYYFTPNQGSAGYRIEQFAQLADDDDVGMTRIQLAEVYAMFGYPLVLSFSTTDGFSNGIDERGFIVNDTGGNDGGHAVEVSGIVTNAELPDILPPGAGGGYFIIKNSWGTGFGDGGYVYLSFAYVSSQAGDITALVEASPAVDTPPAIAITVPALARTTLNVSDAGTTLTFRSTPSDTEDGVLCCTVLWSSDIDGPLGSGRTLSYFFATAGQRTITATAIDSDGEQSSASVVLDLVGPKPTVQIVSPATGSTLNANQVYQLNATASDTSCASIVWTQNGAPLGTGCQLEVSFPNAGTLTIAATATNASGNATAQSLVTIVAPVAPPVLSTNPPVVSIASPASGASFDPNGAFSLVGNATSDGGPITSYLWTADSPGQAAEGRTSHVEIGNAETLSWTPSSSYDSLDGDDSVTLHFYATNANGTSEATITIVLDWPIIR